MKRFLPFARALIGLGLLTGALLFVQGITRGRLFHPNRVVVWVFDIGQGDAIFIDAPNAQVLIDGGPDALVIEKLSAILPPWDRSIDMVINTHPHADHLTGLISVFERYRVQDVLVSGQGYVTPNSLAFEQAATRARSVTAGEMIDLGSRATLTILWPESNLDGEHLEDPNAGSIVSLLAFGETNMLFTGDVGIQEEERFLKKMDHVDVLKVGHHGSMTSSGVTLLETTTPDISVISVGENDYGQPSAIIFGRLKDMCAEVFRTDFDGDVRLVSDGGEPRVHLFHL